jgi:hypothetical protein
MAIGPDRVQVVKRESTADGGDGAEDFDYAAPIAPQEDAIECAGVYLQDGSARDENVYVARNGNNLVFRDVSVGAEKTLSDLLPGGGTDRAWRRHFLLMGG